MTSKAKKHVTEAKRFSKPEVSTDIAALYREWFRAHVFARDAEREIDAGGISVEIEAHLTATIRVNEDAKWVLQRRILSTPATNKDELAIQAHLVGILLVPDRNGQRNPFLLAALPMYLEKIAYSIEHALGVEDVSWLGEVNYNAKKG